MKKAFTLIELLVVISIIAVLLAILMPSLRKVKEKANRVVCLSNLKQLGLGWTMYAQSNDDKIVYGGTLPVSKLAGPEADFHKGETPWVFHSPYNASREEKIENIKKGALWPYMKSLDIYRCPRGEKGRMRTYSIVDGLNSIIWMYKTESILVKRTGQLHRLGKRVVFIDEGGGGRDDVTSTMGWCIYYSVPRWWDVPPLRHRTGTTLSFADGHAEYRRWEDPDTVTYSESVSAGIGVSGFQPENLDLRYMQKAVWGQLGYNPELYSGM